MAHKTYHCSLCGAERNREELNRVDPITGDDSRAYCINLAQCQSPEARKTIDELFVEMFGEQRIEVSTEGARHG
jgi:hypothetical protein